MSVSLKKSLVPALAGLVLVFAGACHGQAVTEQVQCAFGDAQAVPCTLNDDVDREGVHHMKFVSDGHRTTFTGRVQSGWWSGKLDGRPAMGYELNRGHVVISTSDLDARFEWWSRGKQHGTY